MVAPVVYVVDDDRPVRESLAWLVESIGLQARLYADAPSFLEDYRPGETPACLVLDVRMPRMSGMDLQGRLNEQGVALPIIVVTGHADVPLAIRAMKAGAFDFIEKPYNDQLMLETIQNAIERDLDRHAATERREALRHRFARLTPREREVMDLVIQGRSNKRIADQLGISIKTVELHRSNVMSKVAVGSSAELARLAVLAGIGPE